MKTLIKLPGVPPILCYGEWLEDSNCEIICDDEEYDGCFADGAANWTEAAKACSAYAQRHGTFVVELQAC